MRQRLEEAWLVYKKAAVKTACPAGFDPNLWQGFQDAQKLAFFGGLVSMRNLLYELALGGEGPVRFGDPEPVPDTRALMELKQEINLFNQHVKAFRVPPKDIEPLHQLEYCVFCDEGEPRVLSSVGTGVYVHTRTSVGRVVCKNQGPPKLGHEYLALQAYPGKCGHVDAGVTCGKVRKEHY